MAYAGAGCRRTRSGMIAGITALMLVVSMTAVSAQETTPEASQRVTEPGIYTLQITHDGVQRLLLMDVPASYFDSDEPIPVLFGLHGRGHNAEGFRQYANWDAFGEDERVLLIYPEAVSGEWADGRPGITVDDVGFLERAITLLTRAVAIDPERVYLSGYSMGGMMALRAGCNLPDLVAGVAAFATTMPLYVAGECEAAPALPVLFVVGTDDRVIPWLGVRDTYMDAFGSLQYWGEHNACMFSDPMDALPDVDPSDGTRVIEAGFSDCTPGTLAGLLGIVGGGHTVPGAFDSTPLSGAASMDISGAEAAWAFFERAAQTNP